MESEADPRAVAATGDLMQRPKRKTARRKPRVDFSEPERQRRRHAPTLLFDLADLGARDFDLSRVESRHVRSLRLRPSGANTKGFP